MQQVIRTRPPEGSQLDFIMPGILVSGFLFIGLALWKLGYDIAGPSMSGAAALGLLFIWFRAWDFNRHVWLSANPVFIEEPEPEVITQTTYNTRETTPNGQTITYSNLALLDSDWLKIARHVLKHGSISRDAMVAMKLQTPGIQPKELKTGNPTGYERFIPRVMVGSGAGWFRPESGSNILTDVGRVHFTAILYPPTPTTVSEDTPAHEATRDGDDESEVI